MEPIESLKGTNGIISLYNDKIVISRKTFGGVAAFGVVGDKTIFYNSIQGVEYSGGLLRIIPKGCDNDSYNVLKISNVMKAQKDSNCILIPATKQKKAKEICEIINNKVSELNTKVFKVEDSNANKIREFKQLLDEGIITQEEFEIKKKELLK